ncbi:MAG TPA: tryptophan--tRNA ligase [Aquifex aeolicus]|uniref:Tryptophan--tRNA ligase n=1 Tax=Aquifex aeolicus TaxID=63363 RepID=A0A9D1CFB3_AQUAO|nr:tryptophan--tRNA ligase [Aquificales bacterium]HIP98246.1 tryptophan--tRNA ligase [Aquifex aeolicus]HIQ26776.1 tryptophan--tRNA ligase [Aquifex aeolicus]
MEERVIVSGMRPTGKLHLGHYFGVIRNWLKLQEEEGGKYIFIADWHALTTAYTQTQELKRNIEELMLDWISCGLNPDRNILFIQSQVKEHAELHLLFSMITPKSWLELNPTYKDLKYNLLKLGEIKEKFAHLAERTVKEIIQKLEIKIEAPKLLEEILKEYLAEGITKALFEGAIERELLKELNIDKKALYSVDTYGFLGYPVLQAADILIYKGNTVPVGEDQLPHVELTREIARRFNRLYGETFPEPEALLTETPKVVGIDGRKMSKSYNNAIYLSDTEEEVTQKVGKMVTDPQRIRKTDPGRPQICPVFTLHKLFTDKQTLKTIEEDCQKAQIGCVQCKQILAKNINTFLQPMRERRNYYASRSSELWDIFREGAKKARERAQETMEEVRQKMNIP